MPSPPSPPARHSSDITSHRRHSPVVTDQMAQSAVLPRRGRNDESWVEISSQPSSSSLSSIGDEIVTTGLRVQHDPNSRRRRRFPGIPAHLSLPRPQTGTSSQEEYEESESDEDRVMTSSNEQILPPTRATPAQPDYDPAEDSDDDDENATALGRRNSVTAAFTPQPNAFSHPPSSHSQRASGQGSYFPSHHRSIRNDRPSFTSRPSSHATDHDAALRASLTTLLSIGAAAARGLPKREQGGIGGTTVRSNEPMGLRLIPESELNSPSIPANSARPLTPPTRARPSPSVCSQDAIEPGKRKATSGKPSGEKARPLKKKKLQTLDGEALLSPTFMAWVMSAGVVVLVSVVGFGAGYVIGREVGRQEVIAGFNGSSIADAGSCGKEAMKGSAGLRRFKWNLGGAGSVVA